MEATVTYGVDLAARDRRTAACSIEWRPDGSGAIVELGLGVSDAKILAQLANPAVTVTAIDAPFGWPRRFVAAVSEFSTGGSWPAAADDPALRLRVTDFAVRQETGLWPLSVSTDKIGIVAMRCARLLATHATSTATPVDRQGENGIVEVYPAAALHQWSLSQRRAVPDAGTYRGNAPGAEARRARIVELIAGQAPWLLLSDQARSACIRSDDCLDAVICALVARAFELKLVPPVSDPGAAADEGWIHLPRRGSLGDLRPAVRSR